MNYSREQNKKKLKRRNSNKVRTKNKIGLLIIKIIIALILVGVFALIGAGIGAYVGIIESAEPITAVNVKPSIFSSNIVIDSTGEVYTTLKASENREYVTLEYISPNLQNAFIAIEDARFYSHNGIDLKAILRSVYTTALGNGSQGGSTLTQQLIKNSRGIDRNDVKSKLQEQYLAINYEKDMIEVYDGDKKKAKDHILELYLNTISLGNNLNGVQTAANYYFNKEPADLTISESAVIAAITQWPVKYQPVNNPESNRFRQTTVIGYMLEQGMITQAEHDEALNDDVYSRIIANNATTNKGTTNTYYADQVIIEVAKDLRDLKNITIQEAYNLIYNGGLEIRIPIDTHVQDIVDNVFLNEENFSGSGYSIQVTYLLDTKNIITGENKHTERVKVVSNKEEMDTFVDAVRNEVIGANDTIIAENIYPVVQPQASFVVIDNSTGYVVAINGSRGEKLTNLGLNRASQSERHPGSTFKIVAAYAPGTDLKKVFPGSIIVDEEFKSGSHTFKNWYSGYRGPISVREGVEDSVNILAVKTMEEVGINQSIDYLLNFGFTTLVTEPNAAGESDRTLSTALGGLTTGVTNVELTAAYAAIANGGRYREPVFYTQVYDHDNNLLLDNTGKEGVAVISPISAYLLTDMMKGVLTNGTGTAARLRNINMAVAGKTGTASNDHDLWFEGYTPYYTAGVWMGYDMPAPIGGTRNDHKLIWGKIMDQIHVEKQLEYKDFIRPEGIGSATVCSYSGQTPGPFCPGVITDFFEKGYEPSPDEECTYHQGYLIDTLTGMIANEYCPEEYVKIVSLKDLVGDVEEGEDEPNNVPLAACTFHTAPLVEGVDYYLDVETGEKVYITPENPDIFDLLFPELGFEDEGENDNNFEEDTPEDDNVNVIAPGDVTIQPTPTPTPIPTISPTPTPTPPSETPIPSAEPPVIIEIPDFEDDTVIIDDFN